MSVPFTDRAAAGRALADRLQSYAGRKDVVVMALPRGGVPVASEVARALGAPLDLLIVRKLGVPRQPELAMGAIASAGAMYIDPKIVASCGVSARQLDEIVAAESLELIRRHALYCGKREAVPIDGRTVIVVDDGVHRRVEQSRKKRRRVTGVAAQALGIQNMNRGGRHGAV